MCLCTQIMSHTHTLRLDLEAGTPDHDLIINNLMCCGNSASFQVAKDGHGGTLRNVQNPIYGDTSHDRDNSASSRPTQDHLYAIVKTPSQELLTSAA
jgi:hypothetical protein